VVASKRAMEGGVLGSTAVKVGIPKEIVADEKRVALVPEAVGPLLRAGMEVLVECGAGAGACILDRAYEAVGAMLVPGPGTLWSRADVFLKVQKPVLNAALGRHEVELMQEGAVLIAFLEPLSNPGLVKRLTERKITSFSMDCIPRIARAQTMDALSSQSTVAGYKAVLIAASRLPKFFPLLMTAAGTMTPARIFIIGRILFGAARYPVAFGHPCPQVDHLAPLGAEGPPRVFFPRGRLLAYRTENLHSGLCLFSLKPADICKLFFSFQISSLFC